MTHSFPLANAAKSCKSSSLVIKQKDESQNGGSKKTKPRQMFPKTYVSYPLTYSLTCVWTLMLTFFSKNLLYFVLVLVKIHLFRLITNKFFFKQCYKVYQGIIKAVVRLLNIIKRFEKGTQLFAKYKFFLGLCGQTSE